MNIKNNILKHHLKNVYFISGNACGGKTSLSKLLAEKHGFYLYDMDQQYEEHRALADKEYQPEMSYHCVDFSEQYTRPVHEQARWSMSSLREQSEMVIMDLIKLSQDQKVVADVLFMQDYLEGIVDQSKIVFLTVDPSLIREDYFTRPEKKGFYDYVQGLEDAAQYFENIFLSLEEINRIETQMIDASGYFKIERTKESSFEETLAKVEKHFGL